MALIEIGLVVLFVLIVLAVALAAFFFWGLKHALLLAMNSVIGFFALYAVKAWLLPGLIINFWSVILVALLGLAGFILVLILHLFGWFF